MRCLLFLCFLYASVCFGKEPKNYGDFEVSELISVYDGDTFKVNIDGVHPIIGERILIRVAGVDTPELKSKDAKLKETALLAKEFTSQVLTNAKKIELRKIRRDKYFRILAEVYVDGQDLSDLIIKAGLGVSYNGKTKKYK